MENLQVLNSLLIKEHFQNKIVSAPAKAVNKKGLVSYENQNSNNKNEFDCPIFRLSDMSTWWFSDCLSAWWLGDCVFLPTVACTGRSAQ